MIRSQNCEGRKVVLVVTIHTALDSMVSTIHTPIQGVGGRKNMSTAKVLRIILITTLIALGLWGWKASTMVWWEITSCLVAASLLIKMEVFDE